MAFRHLKKQVFEQLRTADLETGLATIAAIPARQVVNPLFSFLYHGDMLIRWRAVTAMGVVVARLADRDMASAQIIMRRLMWNLNDESGGMGWGSPEAMGEIMVRHPQMAEDYASILISYINPDGNYLEHEGLQKGALWGVGRLAHTRPALVQPAARFLIPFLSSSDSDLRGLAAWAGSAIADKELGVLLKKLYGDSTVITLFLAGRLTQRKISDLAKASIFETPSDNR